MRKGKMPREWVVSYEVSPVQIMILSKGKGKKFSPLQFPETDKVTKFSQHLVCRECRGQRSLKVVALVISIC